MKKLSIILITVCSLAFADKDCKEGAQKIVEKLTAHNKTSITLDYSKDKEKQAKACETAIKSLNPAIKVNLNLVEGNNKSDAHF